jgi:hypothetical protein
MLQVRRGWLAGGLGSGGHNGGLPFIQKYKSRLSKSGAFQMPLTGNTAGPPPSPTLGLCV